MSDKFKAEPHHRHVLELLARQSKDAKHRAWVSKENAPVLEECGKAGLVVDVKETADGFECIVTADGRKVARGE